MVTRLNNKFIITALSLFIINSPSIAIPKHSPTPGGIAIIPLEDQHELPKASFHNNPILVIKTPKANKAINWSAIVGIPLSAIPGKEFIEIDTSNGLKKKISFNIIEQNYPVEKINLSDNSKVTPPESLQKRIADEYAQTIKTYENWQPTSEVNLTLKLPLTGRKSSVFGLRRILNGIEKSPHSGLDIAAPLGTPVYPAQDGIVTATENYYYLGNVVFIDHGQGLITSYAHLNKIFVKPGQKIKIKDTLGEVGKTGRVTGAHLHWSVSLNGNRVNPELFL